MGKSQTTIIGWHFLSRKIRLNNFNLLINDDIYNQTLFKIDQLLRRNGKYLKNIIGMPQLPENYSINDTIRSNNIYMNQQYNYDREALKNIVPINVAKFNSDQLIVYNQVLNRI